MSPSILGLVLARGGSKGIPGKNVRPLGGLPLIAHTFAAARASRSLTRVVLSTDDPAIAAVARTYDVEVPFVRPEALATDQARAIDVGLHALYFLLDRDGYQPDYVMLLQPTSPFRTAADIDQAAGLALSNQAPAVVSVTPARQHPGLMKVITHGRLRPFADSAMNEARRQDMSAVYALNGAIYLVRRDVLLATRSWCPEGALAYVMPEERSLDIDTPWDLRLASLLLEARP